MGSIFKSHRKSIPSGFQPLSLSALVLNDPELEPCRFYNSCADTKSSLCNGFDKYGNHKSLKCSGYQDRVDLEQMKNKIQPFGRLSDLESQEAIDEGADPMRTAKVIRATYGMTSRIDTSTPLGFLEKPYEVIDKSVEKD